MHDNSRLTGRSGDGERGKEGRERGRERRERKTEPLSSVLLPSYPLCRVMQSLALDVAKRYKQLYGKDEAERVEREYRATLRRHGRDAEVRRLHKYIGA